MCSRVYDHLLKGHGASELQSAKSCSLMPSLCIMPDGHCCSCTCLAHGMLAISGLASQSAWDFRPVCTSCKGFVHQILRSISVHWVMHLPRVPSGLQVHFPGSKGSSCDLRCCTCPLANASCCCSEASVQLALIAQGSVCSQA